MTTLADPKIVAVPRRQFLIAIIPLFFPNSLSAKPSPFILTIARKHKGDDCCSGYLAVNGSIIAYTLELPYQGNAPLLSSIPDGTYDAELRYDHADGWRIQLSGVPDRTAIQIHTGNTVADSKGCILVGSSLVSNLCGISGSKAAYSALRTAFYGTDRPVSTPDKLITVKIES